MASSNLLVCAHSSVTHQVAESCRHWVTTSIGTLLPTGNELHSYSPLDLAHELLQQVVGPDTAPAIPQITQQLTVSFMPRTPISPALADCITRITTCDFIPFRRCSCDLDSMDWMHSARNLEDSRHVLLRMSFGLRFLEQRFRRSGG